MPRTTKESHEDHNFAVVGSPSDSAVRSDMAYSPWVSAHKGQAMSGHDKQVAESKLKRNAEIHLQRMINDAMTNGCMKLSRRVEERFDELVEVLTR